MPTVNSAWQVSGLTQGLPGQSIGQLSAASSTSGSLVTASAGDYMIEHQALTIDYARVPIYNFATDHAMTVSGYAFAVVPTPSVHRTQIQYMAQGVYKKAKVNGTFAGAYTSPQTFALYTTSAADAGGMYTNQALSGILGVAGSIATSGAWYNRRPWVTGDEEVYRGVVQFNYYAQSTDPDKTDAQQGLIASSMVHSMENFGAYVACNMPEHGIAGLPTEYGYKTIMPLNTLQLWGIYNPAQESQHMVPDFINHVGDLMKIGNDQVPSMRDANNGLNTITEYETWRHSFV